MGDGILQHKIGSKGTSTSDSWASFLGRVHVAKQVLAASLWYHASFERPLEQLLKQLSRQLRRFVASAQQASHSDDALALAQGNSQGSAQLLHIPCMGTCMDTLAILLAFLGWHICVMT